MNTVLFLFLISSLDIFVTFISCQDYLTHQVITNFPPKKIRRMQILNPRKFLKVGPGDSQKWNLKKRLYKNVDYTVFPAMVDNRDQIGAPYSPLFQPDHAIEQKVRIKKVLPDYMFTVNRKKRSVVKADDAFDKRNVTGKMTKKRKRKIVDSIIDKNKELNVKNQKSKRSTLKLSRTENSKKEPKHKSEIVGSSNVRHTKKSKRRNIHKGKRTHGERYRKGNYQKSHENAGSNTRKRNQKSQLNKDSRRLIAGKDAMIADYPYVVSIQKDHEHWCAGALLNPRLVITTANCIWKSNHLSRLRVRAGSRHVERGGQVAKIQEAMKHPRWSIRRGPNNDIALLLLDRNIKFSHSVHSVDLPNRSMMPAFEDAWVTSWGTDRRDGIYHGTHFTLQAYHTRLLDRDKCNNVTQRFGVTVTENFICLTQTGRRAPCTRDTGAPAVSDGILWGLASWGIRKLCGTERFPAMFSYTASPSNMDFIINATHTLMSEKRYYPFPDGYKIQRANTESTNVAPTLAFPHY